MNERTLKALEFDKVLALLQEETATQVGSELVKTVHPEVEFEQIIRLQAETDEAVRLIQLNQALPLSQVDDLSEVIERSRRGGTVDSESCLHIAQMIYVGRKLKRFVEDLEEVESFPSLTKIVSQFYSLRHLEEEITDKIDEYGQVMDQASNTLRSIRSSIRSEEAAIRDKLQDIMKHKSKMLSDRLVTIRNNRYVLPVKHEYRSAIGGIVHDQSSSGQTLFMEPGEVIKINNRLQQQYAKEKQEIERILTRLSEKIATHAEELIHNMQLIAKIDLIHARAKLSHKMDASKPRLNDKGIIKLKQARHPLIPNDEVVANDIALGETYQAIVITGPNTGGKTVTLKTIGLLTLMAQTGLQIPAMDGGELAVFQHVFADIGDEQSIEQNLSTFSSHMTNIVDIMEKIDDKSLILFDEIGAGTDPQEGAALAMALLDYTIAQGARVVATTHYPELKAYGYNRESVMNASVEFDVETLRPTYRLMLGVPGRSNAFEISSRLGLDPSIIQAAKAYLGVDSKNVENMIAALEDSKRQADLRLEEAQQYLEENIDLHQELEKMWQRFEHKRDQLLKDAEEKAAEALKQAREEAQIIVDEIKQMKDQTNWKEHEWIEAKRLLEEARPALVEEKEKKAKISSRPLEVGDEIKHLGLQQKGEIIEKKNDQTYIIQIGRMRITAKKRDLEYIGKAKESEETITKVVTSKAPVKAEIDLRGKRYEEAMYELEAYIDRAVMQNYPQVTIIHGMGTGALRKGVETFIRQSPYIKASRMGGEGEGGAGVTIVEL